MRRLLFALLWPLTLGATAQAQTITNAPGVLTVNGSAPDNSGNATVLTSYLGSYAVSTLPSCTSGNYGKTAYATDLGGGANTVKCAAGTWQHISLGIPSTVAQASGTYTVTPLTTSPILLVTGNILTGLTVSVSATNLYPGYILYVRRPGLLTGTISVGLSTGGATLPVLGSSTGVFVYDGTSLQQVQ